METKYYITGMTCNNCVAQVKEGLESADHVQSAEVDLASGELRISSENALDISVLRASLPGNGKYQISTASSEGISNSETGSTWRKLYPLFLVFAFLVGAVVLNQILNGTWNFNRAMLNFMGGFFVTFSFFKLLDLRGFVQAFRTYDPIAKKISTYAWIYPFIELGLGIAMFLPFDLTIPFILTVLLLRVTTVGVLRVILDKRTIQCACLGTVFELPMTKVTLIENSIMILMAIVLLAQ